MFLNYRRFARTNSRLLIQDTWFKLPPWKSEQTLVARFALSLKRLNGEVSLSCNKPYAVYPVTSVIDESNIDLITDSKFTFSEFTTDSFLVEYRIRFNRENFTPILSKSSFYVYLPSASQNRRDKVQFTQTTAYPIKIHDKIKEMMFFLFSEGISKNNVLLKRKGFATDD